MEPKIKTDIEARVKDTGDTMTGFLNFKEYSRINESHPADLNYTALCLDAVNGDYFTRIANFCYNDGRWGPVLQKWKTDGTYLDGVEMIYNKFPGTFKSNVNGNNILLGTDAVNKVLFRNDGSNFWLLITDKGTDGYNDLRPFRVELSTGKVWLNGGTPLTHLNYNSFSPTLTGGGASGTWNINITGNCAVASEARMLQAESTSASPLAEQFHHLDFFSGGISRGEAAGQGYMGSHASGDLWCFPKEGTYYTDTAVNVQVLRIVWQRGTWYNDLFFSPNSNRMYHRSVQNGTAYNWRRIWEEGDTVTGAVWNDYAEFRESSTTKPGLVLKEKGDDTLIPTEERLSHFCGVSSDTYGFSQGETDKAKTPVAVAGRVLVYTLEPRETYQPGDCVCAGPGGTVSKMTRQEIIEWPDRIVGKVSCVPDYEIWGGGEGADREPVKVDGRIWIQVK